MAKITRFSGNVPAFASASVGGTAERTAFGGGSSDNTLTGNLNGDWIRGWGVVGIGQKPPLQWFNGAMYGSTLLSAYLHQMGVAEWDPAQEYPQHGFSNRNGVIYRSLVNANVGNVPESSTGFWVSLQDDIARQNYIPPVDLKTGYLYYIASDVSPITLPAIAGLSPGERIAFIKDPSLTPVIEVEGAGGETMIQRNIVGGVYKQDSSFFFDIYTAIDLVFNGTDWDF